MEIGRKRRLTLAALGAAAAGGAVGWHFWPRGGLLNACRTGLPSDLATHPRVLAAWKDVDPAACWDTHAHLLGTGDSDSGIFLSPRLDSMLSPVDYIQRRLILNAACVDPADGGDAGYVFRLRELTESVQAKWPGSRVLLLAFDAHVLETGEVSWPLTGFHVPDAYAARVAREHPAQFEWAASIHPYRADAVERVEKAAQNGARAVKWLPAAMGIDPASARCDRFYDALTRLDLPLITHAGKELAVRGALAQHFGNPLRLRRALDRGVRVVVAHCATLGADADLDIGRNGREAASFDLFARLMDEPRWHGSLFGDLSAVTQVNRAGAALARLIERQDWHERLLNGSDYPLVGVPPLFSLERLAALGFLDAGALPVLHALRGYNPLLFDFVTKRELRWRGRRFGNAVFETRRFFERAAP